MDIRSCVSIATKLPDSDRDSLLARVDELMAAGVPAEKAQGIAAADALADIRAERVEMEALLKQQHPSVFKGKASPMLYSVEAPPHLRTNVEALFNKETEKLPPSLRASARHIVKTLRHWQRKALNTWTFTTDLLDRAVRLGLPSAKAYSGWHNQKAYFVGEHEQKVSTFVDRYAQLPDAMKRQEGAVNKLLYDSTREGKWAFKPDWLEEGDYSVDAAMAARFGALPKDAQDFVRDIFRFGNYTLDLKKQTVRDAVSSEYDALIKDAKDRDDKAAVKRYEKDRDGALKQFGSILRLSAKTPYAPLKRYGNYVVVAKSPEYVAAEKAKDYETVKKLQRNEAHYFVDFAETVAQAELMKEKLDSTGQYEEVRPRERELLRNELYSGSNTLQALAKLRANVDAMYGRGASRMDAELDEKQRVSARKLQDMITELYILTLAEDSARRSELKRKGVAGNIDMVRSFETQGRADANFLGGAKFNYPMLEEINRMRRELREGDNQMAKSEIFNEILARHIQGNDYSPSPIVDKTNRLTSVWFLATSPAYYIQNATQPWLMSLPVIAAKHDFGRSASALTQAYQDLAKPFGATGARNFDFEKMLSDSNTALSDGEKNMLRTLLNKQQLDIGMATELGRFRIEGQSKRAAAVNKADDFIRGLMHKMEAMNRISTALAAYRLETSKGSSEADATSYASKIINDTHGDYSAWNSPRAFNTKFGKIALQFRKFQLIQLSLLGKLAKESLHGASAAERAAARKALAFTLGTAFVVGGARGLPIPAVLGLLLTSIFGDAGEPPEYMLRQAIGDNALADILIGGVPAALGANTSSVGFGNTFAVLPFTDINVTERAGLAQTAYALFGGPLGGLGYKAADAAGHMLNGNYYRGVEMLLPRGFFGIQSGMKALRMGTEGATQADGDVTVPADEYKPWDLAQQAVGFTPEKEVRRISNQKTAFTVQEKLDSREQRIKKDYREAIRDRDTAAVSEARRDWAEYNATRKKMGFEPKPMKTLLEAPKAQGKREKNTMGGVQYTKQSEGFVRRLAGV